MGKFIFVKVWEPGKCNPDDQKDCVGRKNQMNDLSHRRLIRYKQETNNRYRINFRHDLNFLVRE